MIFRLNRDEQLFIEGNVIKLEEQSKLNEKRSILTGLYFKKCQTIQDRMYWDKMYWDRMYLFKIECIEIECIEIECTEIEYISWVQLICRWNNICKISFDDVTWSAF